MQTSVVDAVEGYYAALTLDALHQVGALERLASWTSPAGISAELGLDPALVEALTAFLAKTTQLLETNEHGEVRLAGADFDRRRLCHMLDQYVGAYGPVLVGLNQALRGDKTHVVAVDLVRHAAAFAARPEAALTEAGRLVQQLGATRIVELGCGGAHDLCALGAANPDFTAIGIDANREVLRQAAARVAALGLDQRIELLNGDAPAALSGIAADAVQVVLASSFLNGFWSSPGDIERVLRKLTEYLPRRLLVVSDYYPQLLKTDGAHEARTLIHDLAQVASGQGLPPSSLEGWATVYVNTGGVLMHAFEASGDGIDRFVHLVRLGDNA
jgi:precorrin-6B methylase 2